jgi:hypothetical protein
MYGKHWSDADLVARLYDVGPEDDHLAACRSCAQRWEAARLRYESLRPAEIGVSEEFLGAQRRAIHARLEARRPSFRLALIPSLAALLLVVILTVTRPVPQLKVVDQAADSKVFDDVFKLAASTEPNAVGPIRSLFEVER